METVMNGVEKHAEYYRGYLPDDRSVIPLAISLATIVALWLLIYLVSALGPQPRPEAPNLQRTRSPSSSRSLFADTIEVDAWLRRPRASR
jgi:hypothetical protein